MNALKRAQIFYRLREKLPNPTTELIYKTPFQLLIAVILSAQTTDKNVNKATEKLFAIADTAQTILLLGEEKLKDFIKTINLYPTKAKNIIKTCEILVTHYNEQIPSTREALESLPGVGRKTANVVLNTAFGLPVMPVDTHIFRVSNRTRLATGKTVYEVENKLLKKIPKEFLLNAHHWLVLHGRYTCLARKPRCSECIINDLCEYDKKF